MLRTGCHPIIVTREKTLAPAGGFRGLNWGKIVVLLTAAQGPIWRCTALLARQTPSMLCSTASMACSRSGTELKEHGMELKEHGMEPLEHGTELWKPASSLLEHGSEP